MNELDNKNVYLDNAANTRMYPEVIETMKNYMDDSFGNASAAYQIGLQNKILVDNARTIIADTIGADSSCIYFTSGGSEGDNWAIKGVAEAYKNKGKHIITSAIEHKAVLNTCKWLEQQGYDITYITPDDRGIISVSMVEKEIRPDTILVSIMFANNEIGTINPIRHIGELCRKRGIIFHTDAVQAYGHVRINVNDLGIDLLTASSHKFHGPTGVGFLYVNKKVMLPPLIHGGHQEQGIRAGTENVLGIIGMAKAAEMVYEDFDTLYNKTISMRDIFIQEVLNDVPKSHLNGSLICRLCNNVSITFEGVPGEEAVAMLDMHGVTCSSGSACNTGDANPSHVLTGVGATPEYASQTLRFTLSDLNTPDEIYYAIEIIKRDIETLRALHGVLR